MLQNLFMFLSINGAFVDVQVTYAMSINAPSYHHRFWLFKLCANNKPDGSSLHVSLEDEVSRKEF